MNDNTLNILYSNIFICTCTVSIYLSIYLSILANIYTHIYIYIYYKYMPAYKNIFCICTTVTYLFADNGRHSKHLLSKTI